SEKAVRKGTLLVNDLAESQLISAIKDKNITAIIFWLKNNNPKYSERKINLPAKEMGEIINAVISSDPEYTLKLLTQRLIEGKIPRFFVNTLNSIISKSIKVNQLKVDAQKVKLLNQFS
nr:hypothetical protein [Candidatus Shapirobacteria bacterium]